MRNFQYAGRSPVHSTNGMAATSNPLATITALNVLRDGGNAVDAAVAACAVQCVVEPESTGIGGDCFALIAPKGGSKIVAYNGSGRAPKTLTADWLLERGIKEIERHSPHAVTIPGAVDAWAQLIANYGSRDLAAVLKPAIGFARDGYPIHSRVFYDWNNNLDVLRREPNMARTFLANGRVPAVGSRHKQPELGATLERIAKQGRDGFYKGPVAEDIVSYLRSLGGLHTLEDFAEARGEYVEPIRTSYRGYDVFECPPNGQGITALIMLNILSGLTIAGTDPLSVERLHLMIEAARLAYADRNAFVADPAKSPVPIEDLLSNKHADELRAKIDPNRAAPVKVVELAAYHDTVYLCVVDKDRNAVSFINSLYFAFGSGLMAAKSGVVLQNRGQGFVVKPGHPNCVAPGKRPMHTIIPGMLVKDGRAVMPFGVMGGQYQAYGHAQFLTNVLDFGLDLQEALDLPRVFPNPGEAVDVEAGVPEASVKGLQKRGHPTAPAAKPHGGGQAIRIDWQEGVLTGGSDPRKDGCALGY